MAGRVLTSKDLDPALADLFSQSSLPPAVPSKSRDKQGVVSKIIGGTCGPGKHGQHREAATEDGGDGLPKDKTGEKEENAVKDVDSSNDQDQNEVTEVLEEARRQLAREDERSRKRKKKKHGDNDDLEGRYLQRLEEKDEPESKRVRGENGKIVMSTKTPADDILDDQEPPGGEASLHESREQSDGPTELEKANCTAFLSNVSVEAVISKKAKKILLAHLSSVLDQSADPPQAIKTIRFRSTAYSTVAQPKRASFALGAVMDATTKSTNAYVVYNSPSAVRTAVAKLNGSMILDRHLRVDSVAHPAPQDHKRCVFVGNLGFINDETVLNSKVDDETGKEVVEKRKRNKQPMDVEEGLWQVFGRDGRRVENVRVVRDVVTRVGKGFAYVQFYDANDVEAALLLTDKSFPPMLPRKLRVTRCKAPQRTARAMEARQNKTAAQAKPGKGQKGYVPKPTAKQQSLAGRAKKLLGRAAASRLGLQAARPPKKESTSNSRAGPEVKGVKAATNPEHSVFEGRRASAKDGKPKDLKFKGSRSNAAGKARKKASARSRAWKTAAKGGAGTK